MIEHDCNTAAQQAGYRVGEEHDPDPPALEQGTGRDLTCQPYPGATARRRGLTGRALVLWRTTAQQAHWHIRHPCRSLCYPGEATLYLRPEDNMQQRCLGAGIGAGIAGIVAMIASDTESPVRAACLPSGVCSRVSSFPS